MVNVNTPISQLPPAVSINGSETMVIDQAGTTKRTTLMSAINGSIQTNFNAAVEYVSDGLGVVLTPGVKGYLEIPFAAYVVQADVYGDNTSGSIEVDVWRCSYSDFDAGTTHPTSADSIFGGTLPTIVNDSKTSTSYSSGILLNAGDILAFDIHTVSGFTRVTTSLKLTRSFTGSS